MTQLYRNINGQRVPMTPEEAAEFEASRLPPPPTVQDVKTEAGRRILERYPEWRQANMTARAVQLVDIKLERELTAEEVAEEAALKASWAWISTVRLTSDAIEQMDPIPQGFDADGRWPAWLKG